MFAALSALKACIDVDHHEVRGDTLVRRLKTGARQTVLRLSARFFTPAGQQRRQGRDRQCDKGNRDFRLQAESPVR